MVKKFEDMFIRFDTIHERDGHTHTRTHRQTPNDDIARAHASYRAAKMVQDRAITTMAEC